MNSIISELYNPKKYDQNKYPFLEYFMFTKNLTEDDFKNEFYKIENYEDLYSLISSYLNPKNNNIKLLSYLPEYNKYLNGMIDKYSYEISREEVKMRKYDKNESKGFLEAWNEIKEYNSI